MPFEDELSEIASRYKKESNKFADEVREIMPNIMYGMFIGLNVNRNEEERTVSYSGAMFTTEDTNVVEMVFMKEILANEIGRMMQ